MTTWNAVLWPKLWCSLCLVGSLAISKSLFSLSCVNTSRLSLFQPMLFCLDQARLVFAYILYMMTFWCLPLSSNFSPSIVSDSVIQRQFRTFVKSAQNTDQILDLTAWLSLTGNGQKKNTLQGQGKVREYYFESEKLTYWRKVRENWNGWFDILYCSQTSSWNHLS